MHADEPLAPVGVRGRAARMWLIQPRLVGEAPWPGGRLCASGVCMPGLCGALSGAAVPPWCRRRRRGSLTAISPSPFRRSAVAGSRWRRVV